MTLLEWLKRIPINLSLWIFKVKEKREPIDLSYMRNDLILRGFLFKRPDNPKGGDCWFGDGSLSFESQSQKFERALVCHKVYYFEWNGSEQQQYWTSCIVQTRPSE